MGDCDINKRVKLNEVDFGYYAWIALLYRSLILTQKEKKELYRYFIFVSDLREF